MGTAVTAWSIDIEHTCADWSSAPVVHQEAGDVSECALFCMTHLSGS